MCVTLNQLSAVFHRKVSLKRELVMLSRVNIPNHVFPNEILHSVYKRP